jgi:hypothetical protein
MSAMDARRLALYELLKPTLDEEPARELVLALPAAPDQLATKNDLTSQFDSLEAKLDVKFAQIEARFDRMENVLTRRMVAIMGAWTILVGSTVGWIFALAR